VDERPGDTGLQRDASDAKSVSAFGHDHAARSAQDLVDAIAHGPGRRLLDSGHRWYPD
jgi:hypothetical protein